MSNLDDKMVNLLNSVAKAVDERGSNYVYQPPSEEDPCAYLHGERPGCVFGCALLDSGLMTKTALRKEEGLGIADILNFRLHVDRDFGHAMGEVQAKQDNGKTWGESFAHGLDHLEKCGYDVTPWDKYRTRAA